METGSENLIRLMVDGTLNNCRISLIWQLGSVPSSLVSRSQSQSRPESAGSEQKRASAC